MYFFNGRETYESKMFSHISSSSSIFRCLEVNPLGYMVQISVALTSSGSWSEMQILRSFPRLTESETVPEIQESVFQQELQRFRCILKIEKHHSRQDFNIFVLKSHASKNFSIAMLRGKQKLHLHPNSIMELHFYASCGKLIQNYLLNTDSTKMTKIIVSDHKKLLFLFLRDRRVSCKQGYQVSICHSGPQIALWRVCGVHKNSTSASGPLLI